MNRRERRAHWRASQRAALNLAPPVARLPLSDASARPRNTRSARHSAINLQIGELVLRGIERRHSSRITASFERRLAELLGTGALPDPLRRSASSPSIRLAPLRLLRLTDPVAIGEQLAASVFAFKRDVRRRGGSR